MRTFWGPIDCKINTIRRHCTWRTPKCYLNDFPRQHCDSGMAWTPIFTIIVSSNETRDGSTKTAFSRKHRHQPVAGRLDLKFAKNSRRTLARTPTYLRSFSRRKLDEDPDATQQDCDIQSLGAIVHLKARRSYRAKSYSKQFTARLWTEFELSACYSCDFWLAKPRRGQSRRVGATQGLFALHKSKSVRSRLAF